MIYENRNNFKTNARLVKQLAPDGHWCLQCFRNNGLELNKWQKTWLSMRFIAYSVLYKGDLVIICCCFSNWPLPAFFCFKFPQTWDILRFLNLSLYFAPFARAQYRCSNFIHTQRSLKTLT